MKEQSFTRMGLTQASFVLNRETQMVLPAVLLLFVFQVGMLVNGTFNERMSRSDHVVAAASLFALAVGAAGLLTPVVYGRTEPHQVSRRTVGVARAAGRGPLVALAVKLASDVYLEARAVTSGLLVPILFGSVVMVVCAALWGVLPSVGRRTAPGVRA